MHVVDLGAVSREGMPQKALIFTVIFLENGLVSQTYGEEKNSID